MTLAGKVAIVTGAGRGIGRSIALALGARGATLVVSARTQAQIDDTAGAIRSAGGKAAAVRTDMRTPARSPASPTRR